ncbi:MAG TPA: 2-oxo-4-hydroxy-4-carboxy-5-ureidoimidazoline decarboxylase [Casimicrobiaceae bacterium]|nr:2-oxo-4-hydroxy-4-carboxy-5-ureidoimidazoline decarboxylase [Casimicrobiaceae bacterium]
MTLAELNRVDRAAFVNLLGGIFERSPWVAERSFDDRPFAGVGDLHSAMVEAMTRASAGEQRALLQAHPELAGREASRGELTVESAREQGGAGLDQCSPAELARMAELNRRYRAKFGFPFIVAVRGMDRAAILREFGRRVEHDQATEFAEALQQVAKIARLRLEALIER